MADSHPNFRQQDAAVSPSPQHESNATPSTPTSPGGTRTRATSSLSGRARTASLKFMESNPPSGFMAATGEAAGRAPSLADIRRGSYGSGERRPSLSGSRAESSGSRTNQLGQTSAPQSPTIHEHEPASSRFAPQIPPLEEKRNTQGFADVLNDDMFASKISHGLGAKKGTNLETVPSVSSGPNQEFDDDDKDSLLDELDRKPKRRSKNMSALLGEDAGVVPSGPGGSKRNTRDFADMIEAGDYEPGKGKLDNQAYVPGHSKRASRASAFFMDGASTNNPKTLDTETTTVTRSTPSPDPEKTEIGPNEDGYYPNGYHFPEKKSWKEATAIGFKATAKFPFSSILNFLITIYGLNVVAWGGMLFLLLCNAGPAMCRLDDGRFDCNDINSPRRIWIEIDSQILNALFCVTGFGLVPWRFRDWYFLLKWRVRKDNSALRRLAGIHNSWFRLPGSDGLPIKADSPATSNSVDGTNEAIPIPASKTPSQPLTGVRAAPTSLWRMDYVVWAFVINTFLQTVLSGFMWGLNRYDRPSWSTGLFVALACIVAAMGGFMQFSESKRIKKVEGVPLPDDEVVGKRTEEGTQGSEVDEKAKGGLLGKFKKSG